MKKFFAAALATAMVVSMAATSFAVTTVNDSNFYLDDDGVVNSGAHTGNVAYGKTIYYAFEDSGLISDYDAVKGTSIKQKWDMNGTAIEKLEILKKKNANGDYAYYLAVKTKANNITSTTDVAGKVTLTKSSPATAKFTAEVDVKFTLGYKKAESKDITSTTQIFDFATAKDTDSAEVKKYKLGSDEEDTISFAGGYMTVNTVGQTKMLISLSTKYNQDIAAKYPTANLDFMTFNGASFNKTGELTIEADPNTLLYQVNADGNLVAVKASYDEYEEAFKVKTRTLGAYVISDVELKAATAPVDTTKPNPGTGANA